MDKRLRDSKTVQGGVVAALVGIVQLWASALEWDGPIVNAITGTIAGLATIWAFIGARDLLGRMLANLGSGQSGGPKGFVGAPLMFGMLAVGALIAATIVAASGGAPGLWLLGAIGCAAAAWAVEGPVARVAVPYVGAAAGLVVGLVLTSVIGCATSGPYPDECPLVDAPNGGKVRACNFEVVRESVKPHPGGLPAPAGLLTFEGDGKPLPFTITARDVGLAKCQPRDAPPGEGPGPAPTAPGGER